MGLSVEQKANNAYNVLSQEVYLSALDDEQLEKLYFLIYAEVMDRAIAAGRYTPCENFIGGLK